MKGRIVALLHEGQRTMRLNYLLSTYVRFWQEDDYEVVYLFGTREFVPADIAIVHVDLSVVPREYLEFAKQYPVVLNGHIKDIRKSVYSQLLLKPDDAYDGRVIVKSNYNYAGVPERSLGVLPATAPLDYRLFEHLRQVPREYFTDPLLVVEKFQPEFEGGLYHMRAMVFLGNRVSCSRISSEQPIVRGTNQVRVEDVEPHPDILRLKEAMNFHYGKFDYVMHQGRPILLDINKTVGAPPNTTDPRVIAGRRYRAEGLYEFLRATP